MTLENLVETDLFLKKVLVLMNQHFLIEGGKHFAGIFPTIT